MLIKYMLGNLNKNLIPLAIVIAGFLIAGAIIYVNQQKQKEKESQKILSSQQIGEKVINYINENILQGRTTASLKEIVEENGLYKIIIKVEDQEFPSYVSRDGKLLFPEFINLEEKISPPAPLVEEESKVSEEKPLAEPSSLEAFAKCLTEKGMKFYGSANCGWCQKQNQLFGEAAKYLPYIECSEIGTKEMITQCQAAQIQAFPTWTLPNGEKSLGFKTLEELAELSGCQL